MKRFIVLISVLLTAITATSQISTYTTKIGNFNGPVKSVISNGDFGTTIDYFNSDGTIQKSISSAKDQYVVFEWTENIITQKFYNTTDDSFVGESKLEYSKSENGFTVSIDKFGKFQWNFDESSLTSMAANGIVQWIMKTEDKTQEGYNSVMYAANGAQFSKTSTKTYDPDQHGNFTRLVTVAHDGSEHEINVSYEYYE